MANLSNSLKGLNVVEVSSLVAGPALGSLLCSLGANVFKIEHPASGDPSRQITPWGFANYNYGKKSISLNLKTEEGRTILSKLIARADIFIENLGPDVSERLGFSYALLRKRNPRLIYCSIKGFARKGKDYNKPAFDAIAQALSGTMSLTGEPHGEPLRVGNPSVDLGAAAYGAIEILASLLHLKRFGKGRFLEISLLDMSVYWNGYWLTYYGMSGKVPERLGSGHPGFCPHRVFKTKDNQYVFIATLNDSQWERLVSILTIRLPTDYDKMPFRLSHRRNVENAVAAKVGQLDLIDVTRMLSSDVPCAKVNSIKDVYDNKDFSRRRVLVQAKFDETQTKIVTPPIVLHHANTITKVGGKHSEIVIPKLGEDTLRLLRDLHYTSEQVRSLRSLGVI